MWWVVIYSKKLAPYYFYDNRDNNGNGKNGRTVYVTR